jgi:hypothetical protein
MRPCQLEIGGQEETLLIAVEQMSDRKCLGKRCQEVFDWKIRSRRGNTPLGMLRFCWSQYLAKVTREARTEAKRGKPGVLVFVKIPNFEGCLRSVKTINLT